MSEDEKLTPGPSGIYDIVDVDGEEMFGCSEISEGIVVNNIDIMTMDLVDDIIIDHPVLSPEGLICIKFPGEVEFFLRTDEDIREHLGEEDDGFDPESGWDDLDELTDD
jgi:hypothetical protein